MSMNSQSWSVAAARAAVCDGAQMVDAEPEREAAVPQLTLGRVLKQLHGVPLRVAGPIVLPNTGRRNRGGCGVTGITAMRLRSGDTRH
jgi:hypothetical protein